MRLFSDVCYRDVRYQNVSGRMLLGREPFYDVCYQNVHYRDVLLGRVLMGCTLSGTYAMCVNGK